MISVSLRWITLRWITLRWITLRWITLRWITLKKNAFVYKCKLIWQPACLKLNFFTLTFRALGRNHIASTPPMGLRDALFELNSRIPLVRTSSKSAARRPAGSPRERDPNGHRSWGDPREGPGARPEFMMSFLLFCLCFYLSCGTYLSRSPLKKRSMISMGYTWINKGLK